MEMQNAELAVGVNRTPIQTMNSIATPGIASRA
jgi:hypothetical protein